MNIPEIKALLDRYLAGDTSPREQELVEQCLEEGNHPHNDWETMSPKDKEACLASCYKDILENIRSRPAPLRDRQTGEPVLLIRRRSWRVRLQAAAMVLLLAGTGIFYLLHRERQDTSAIAGRSKPTPVRHDVAPGSSKAVLTLADGRAIPLDSTQNGVLAKQGNTNISKEGEQLIYKGASGGNPEVAYNTLTTPRGGQYRLVLPDGSRVWLNAASSIHYPTTFSGEQRMVEITGEAYFEIASMASPDRKRSKWPFRVMINTLQKNNRATIDVLGTHFNINAYDDEPDINTTLLEGSIKITALSQSPGAPALTRQLAPGQEARLDKSGDIKVQEANIEEAVAWKEGLFLLNKTDIVAVLRQMARWYDVEIVYNTVIPKGRITGDIPRDMPLADALKAMQLSGVRLLLKGNKIIVDH